MSVPFVAVPVVSSLHDPSELRDMLSGYAEAMGHIGGVVHAASIDLAGPDVLVVLVGTGGTEQAILDLWHRRQLGRAGEPLLLVTHPLHNALPAALEALARVQQDGGRGRIVHVDGAADREGLDRLAEAVLDLHVRGRLRQCRIGLVGEPSSWLVASSPTDEVVAERWGPEIVHVDMADTIASYEDVRRSGAVTLVGPIGRRLAVVSADGSRHHEPHPEPPPDDDAVRDAARVTPVLQRVVRDHRLDALAVRCFDLLSAVRTSGCVALAELNDTGVVAGCEADIPATLAMVWVRELMGATSWMANPAHVDVTSGLVVLAHCTVAPSLVEDLELRSHFESGIGVGIGGRLPPGPATVVRIGGAALEQLRVADVEVRATDAHEGSCRTQAELVVSRTFARELLDRPLGNHLVLLRGHHADHLRRWWQEMVAPVTVG